MNLSAKWDAEDLQESLTDRVEYLLADNKISEIEYMLDTDFYLSEWLYDTYQCVNILDGKQATLYAYEYVRWLVRNDWIDLNAPFNEEWVYDNEDFT